MSSTPSLPSLAIETRTLSNGLRVVVHPDPSLPLVAVNVWYHVGSKNERAGRTGLAHLFEHMLFQGSENVGTNDHFALVQQVGGVANGSTWFDRTNYYETLPSAHLDLGLWLEADRMGWLLPALTDEKLENQRDVVMNERRQRVDNQPYGRAFEALNQHLYPAPHPYQWPVIGYMDDIASATMEDVESFFRTWYAPDNAVLTIAGDVDPEVAFDRASAYFGEIPTGPPRPSHPHPTEERPDRAFVRLPDQVHLPRCYIGFRGPGYGHTDWYALDLLASVLTDGRSSPVYLDLVYERQVAQTADAFLLPTEIEATFGLVSTVRAEADVDDVHDRLLRHLDTVCSEGVHEADFERARNKLILGQVEGFQQIDQRADLIGCCTTYFDDPGRAGLELDRYLELTPSDLVNAAERWLATDHATTVIVEPA